MITITATIKKIIIIIEIIISIIKRILTSSTAIAKLGATTQRRSYYTVTVMLERGKMLGEGHIKVYKLR